MIHQTHFCKLVQYVSLNPFPNNLLFLRLCCTRPLKTSWEKEKLLVTSNFSFSHGVFYPFGELCTIFIEFEIFVCKLSQIGSLRVDVWERVIYVYINHALRKDGLMNLRKLSTHASLRSPRKLI